jgi:hypothetical protein
MTKNTRATSSVTQSEQAKASSSDKQSNSKSINTVLIQTYIHRCYSVLSNLTQTVVNEKNHQFEFKYIKQIQSLHEYLNKIERETEAGSPLPLLPLSQPPQVPTCYTPVDDNLPNLLEHSLDNTVKTPAISYIDSVNSSDPRYSDDNNLDFENDHSEKVISDDAEISANISSNNNTSVSRIFFRSDASDTLKSSEYLDDDNVDYQSARSSLFTQQSDIVTSDSSNPNIHASDVDMNHIFLDLLQKRSSQVDVDSECLSNRDTISTSRKESTANDSSDEDEITSYINLKDLKDNYDEVSHV